MNEWIGSLSKDVFWAMQQFCWNVWHIISMRINTRGISNLVASSRFKEKTPHFRLTCISQKRLCSSSPIFNCVQLCSGHAFFVGVVEAQIILMVGHASGGSYRPSEITRWCNFAQLTSNCIRWHNLRNLDVIWGDLPLKKALQDIWNLHVVCYNLNTALSFSRL